MVRGRLLPLCTVALAIGAGMGLILERTQSTGVASTSEASQDIRKKSASGSSTPSPPTLRSTDTLEDILRADFPTRYARLALWSLDASGRDLEAMFGSLLEHEGTTPPLLNLLLAQWARVDPRRMIEVTRGSSQEDDAWLAWGMADPMTAYAAAKNEDEQRLAKVLQGIGMHNPELALRLAENHPGAMAWSTIGGITEGLGQTDPPRAAEFMRSFGNDDAGLILNWAQRDPGNLLEWCVENEHGTYMTEGVSMGLQTVAREHPERLPELLASLPSGQIRTRLLQAAMQELASHDIDAAIALVNQQDGEKHRRNLYAALGVALVAIDAESSVELFRSVTEQGFSLTPKTVLTPSSSFSEGYGSAELWVRTLAPEAPRDTMDLVRGMELDSPARARLEQSVAGEWLKRDEAEFSDWLREEPANSQRDELAMMLSQRLLSGREPDFESAVEWGASISESPQDRSAVLFNTIQHWVRTTGREEVARYFESGAAPANAQPTWKQWQEDNP